MQVDHAPGPVSGRSTRLRSIFLLVAVVLLLMGAAAIAVIERRERTEFLQADADRILDDPRLAHKTLARGHDVFLTNCAGCHGADGRGSTAMGTPDLTDQDFLYGTGRASEIEQIVLHGIRSGDDKGWDLAWMPAFGQPVPYPRGTLPTLSPGEIEQLTSYLRAMNGAIGEDPAAVSAGGLLFEGHGACWIAMDVTRKGTPRSALPTSGTASGCAGTVAGATSAASFGRGSTKSVRPFADVSILRRPGPSPCTSRRFMHKRKMNELPGG